MFILLLLTLANCNLITLNNTSNCNAEKTNEEIDMELLNKLNIRYSSFPSVKTFRIRKITYMINKLSKIIEAEWEKNYCRVKCNDDCDNYTIKILDKFLTDKRYSLTYDRWNQELIIKW